MNQFEHRNDHSWELLRVEIFIKETFDWLGAITRRYGMGETYRDKEKLGR